MGHQTCQHGVYRLSCEEFEALWARAGGCCEICGISEEETPGGRLGIDHDDRIELCWAVRGILCLKCNNLMGFVDRGLKWTNRAEEYEQNAWHKTHPPTFYYAPHPLATEKAWKELARREARQKTERRRRRRKAA